MKRSLLDRSLTLPLIPVATLVACLAVNSYGQVIALDPSSQSVNEAIATLNNTSSSTVDGNVNSLPYSTATSATAGTASSTITPNLSSSSLTFAFNQSVAGSQSSDSGEGTIFFTALVNATYSISGSVLATGSGKTGAELSAYLLDTTTSTYLYQYDNIQGGSFGSTSATLDNSIVGTVTGNIVAGDSYTIDVYDATGNQGAESLSGTTTYMFTPTPEPSTWAIMAVGAGLLVGFKSMGRNRKISTQA